MVSYPKILFFKNNNKIIQSKVTQYKYQNSNKTDVSRNLLSRSQYHFSRLVKCTTMTLRRFTVFPPTVGIQLSTNLVTIQSDEFTDSSPKVQHLTLISSQNIMQLSCLKNRVQKQAYKSHTNFLVKCVKRQNRVSKLILQNSNL